MIRKQTVLMILVALCALAGSVHASSVHSSYSIVAGEPTIISSLSISPVPLIREVKPLQPRLFPQPETKPSSVIVSSGLNSGSHTGLSPSELSTLLGSSRVLNHENNQWEDFMWSPSQRETIITSWIASNDKIGSSRDLGSEMYYNSDKPVKSKELARSKWKSFRERFLKKE